MQTLQLQNGDLVLSNGAFALIDGPARVQQDIMVASLTPLGSNQFHIKYGSVFNNYIGLPATMQISSLVKTEFNRILQNYMKIQAAQVKRAAALGIQSPFTQGEIILSVQDITVTQVLDRYYLHGSVISGTGNPLQLATTAGS